MARKVKAKQRMDRKTLLAVGLLVILTLGLTYAPKLLAPKCPGNAYGTNNSNYAKYFSSPFCVSCWTQKPILEKLGAERGKEYLMEEFDADWCRNFASPYFIQGVPSFIINNTIVYGVQSQETLERLMNLEGSV